MSRYPRKPMPKAHIVVVYRTSENVIDIEAKTAFFGCALRGGKELMKAIKAAQQDPTAVSVSYYEGNEHVTIPIVHE